MRDRLITGCLILGMLFGFVFTPASARGESVDEFLTERYCTVYNALQPDETIFVSGRHVSLGDEYQAADDRLFRVIRVEGDSEAYAEEIGQVTADDLRVDFVDILNAITLAKAPAKGGKEVVIGLYHTHSDESYAPSDGTSSIRGGGGIYKVGSVLAEALKQAGAKVIHSQAKHDPHDAAAYQRSRRTASELLKEADAILDVHRDAVPKEHYEATVKGEKIAQIQLVVGRQNPNMSANKQFAQEIKAVCDKEQPGLIKGIFFARSGYNQDLSPRNLLLEMGSDKNTREEAEKGASLFAKSYAGYLTASAAGSQAGQARESKAGFRSLGWLLAALVIGGAVFMFVSTGSGEELGSKLRSFGRREFNDLWGSRKDDGDDGNK